MWQKILYFVQELVIRNGHQTVMKKSGIGIFTQTLFKGFCPQNILCLLAVCSSFLFIAATCDKDGHKIIVDAMDVTNITATTATCGGYVFDDGGSPIIVRGVVWDVKAGPRIDSGLGYTADGSGTGQYVSQITGLEPATRYYVRAYASNENDTGYSQQTMTFITLDAPDQ